MASKAAKSAGSVDWEAIERALPVKRGPDGRAARKKLFDAFDPNHNGILSFNEVSVGLQRDLHVPSIRDLSPAIHLACQAARAYAPPVANFHADYIDFNHFRILLIYLKHYVELWEFFQTIDTSGDRRITYKEFESHLSLFKEWGLPDVATWEKDPKAAFDKIDTNGGGMILFDEFANYCLKAGLHKLGAGDDEEEERQAALDMLKQKQPSIYNEQTLAAGGKAAVGAGGSPVGPAGGPPNPGDGPSGPGSLEGGPLPDTGLGDAFGNAISNLVSPNEDVQEYLQASLLPILTPAIEALLHHVHETGEMQKALKLLQDESRPQGGASRSRGAKAGVSEEAEEIGSGRGEAEEIGFDPLVWLGEALRQHAKGPTDIYRPGIEERIAELRMKREEEEALLAAQEYAAQEAEDAAAAAEGGQEQASSR